MRGIQPAAVLGLCIGWALAGAPTFGQSIITESHAETPMVSARAAGRLLDQAAWGPSPASIAQVRRIGIRRWLDWQFSLNESDLPDQPILDSAGKLNNNLAPVQAAFFDNALNGNDQLRQRVAFALSEIWVVSAVSTRGAYAYPHYWRIFRDHAFGNYRDLIKAVTLSPAMGNYLNMANNNKANPITGSAANENYARELLQLFTLGLTELNADGSQKLDASHNPVPTYTQAEITDLAKALTGWTYPTAPGAAAKTNNPAYSVGEMFAVAAHHDTTAKHIFGGVTIPAGQTAEQDLEAVLDALMKQQTMAPFVCTQLIQHLVTSNPSPAYVSRVSSVFLDDGNGVRGNLKAVVNAILTDDEARAGDEPGFPPAAFGHLREPVLFMANILRGLNATLGPSSALYANASQMGQNLFYALSVFSYFSPQYRTEKGLLGPEFQIYSTQTASYRANVANAILYGALDKSTKVDLAPFTAAAAADVTRLLDLANRIFLHHAASPELLAAAADAANAAATPLTKAQAALYIMLTSGEYQVIQ